MMNYMAGNEAHTYLQRAKQKTPGREMAISSILQSRMRNATRGSIM